jgi:hypothetical protein
MDFIIFVILFFLSCFLVLWGFIKLVDYVERFPYHNIYEKAIFEEISDKQISYCVIRKKIFIRLFGKDFLCRKVYFKDLYTHHEGIDKLCIRVQTTDSPERACRWDRFDNGNICEVSEKKIGTHFGASYMSIEDVISLWKEYDTIPTIKEIREVKNEI